MSIRMDFRLERSGFVLNVRVSFPGRGVTALFGPSGCGKTTLLRAIAGLEYCKNGYLEVNRRVWQKNDFFLPTHKRSVGFVFQEAALFDHLNVRRNIEYGLKRLKGSASGISIEELVGLLDIKSLLSRKTSGLSGGERQRVAIARALAANPDMLLLDEPFSALDEMRKKEILPYLESVHRALDIPVLYVSHSRHEVARLAEHLILMEQGRVKASGRMNDLLTRLDLPLSRETEAETLIEATVAGVDEAYGLTWLDFSGGRLAVAAGSLPKGRRVRLQILARDVGITLQPQVETSVLNIFPVIVDQLAREGQAHMIVRLMAGPIPLLSRITRKSADTLKLEAGDRVYAQIKTAALLI